MTSFLPIDLELENFGWSEDQINNNSIGSYNSIVDNTMSIAIFLIIYIYCLIEFVFELIINDLKIKIVVPRISLFNFFDYFVSPRLSAR